MPSSQSENVIPIRPGLESMCQRAADDEVYYQGMVRLLLAIRLGVKGEEYRKPARAGQAKRGRKARG